jgi:hypothetical protein
MSSPPSQYAKTAPTNQQADLADFDGFSSGIPLKESDDPSKKPHE